MDQNSREPADSTALNACRFSSIMAVAMTMSAAVAHFMELPAKMQYEPPLYVRLHRTLYPTFGKTAGPAEAVAVASTAALAWMAQRQRRRSSRLTVAAAGCLAAAHGIFWSVVQPANIEMMRWPLDAIPQDWANWRNRWEYGHAVRAGLVTTALGALTWSVLRDAADPVV
jgi:Anthrone oxygenase